MAHAPVVVPLDASHVAQAAALVAALGYPPPSPIEFHTRWSQLGGASQQVFVAELDAGVEETKTVAGWLHVVGVPRLDSDGYAEVLSLVVGPAWHRRGVGRALMQAAQDWARAAAFDRLRLRSGLHRTEAHAFYAALGYSIARAGHTFEKRL